MTTDRDAVLRRTVLFDAHRALGAKIVPFAGFEMPVQYTSILREHAAVRRRAGLFDLSHMGQIELRGRDAGAWFEASTVNFIANMKPGQARYNIFTNPNGGAHDDVIFYRIDEERWLLVVNAANADKMGTVLETALHDFFRAVDARGELFEASQMRNAPGRRALIALQGPHSVGILARFAAADVAAMKYYSCLETTLRGVPALVARTGYTGEDGFEIFCAAENAVDLWDALLADGRADGLEPAGLGARDVLRLEAGMPLYGHELTEEITPLQAGLGWAVKFAKPAFAGKTALERQQAAGDYPRIVGLVLDGKVPARAGYAVYTGEDRIGEVRSGSIAPSVDNRNIATALVAAAAATVGTEVAVDIRGVRHAARVVALPFYKRAR